MQFVISFSIFNFYFNFSKKRLLKFFMCKAYPNWIHRTRGHRKFFYNNLRLTKKVISHYKLYKSKKIFTKYYHQNRA